MKTDLSRLYKIQIINYISVETPQQGENTISFKEASDKMIPILHAFSCILVIYNKKIKKTVSVEKKQFWCFQ